MERIAFSQLLLEDVEAEEARDPEAARYIIVFAQLKMLRALGITDAEIEHRYSITLRLEHRAPILPAQTSKLTPNKAAFEPPFLLPERGTLK